MNESNEDKIKKIIHALNEKGVFVENAPDTSILTPTQSDSWIDFWRDAMKFNDKQELSCVRCGKPATSGGHVWKTTHRLPLYIVPLCDSCNNPNNTTSFMVDKSILVEEDESDKKEWFKLHPEASKH